MGVVPELNGEQTIQSTDKGTTLRVVLPLRGEGEGWV